MNELRKTDLKNGAFSRIPHLYFIVIILVVSFGVFLNSLSNEFVWDDAVTMENYIGTRDVKGLAGSIVAGIWDFNRSSNYYRPMVGVLYQSGYLLSGREPWGSHLVNILFHCGVSVLVFMIISRLLRCNGTPAAEGGVAAFAGALLFATHPIHTESVAWISGMTDLSFSFFYLLSLLLYIRRSSDDKKSTAMLILSVSSFFAACLCKEPAVTLPFILVAYDYAFGRASSSRGLPGRIRGYLPYLILAAGYFVLRFHSLGGFAPAEVSHKELGISGYLINVLPLLMDYLEKLLLPVGLNAFYMFHPISSLLEMRGIISLFVTAVLIFFVLSALRWNRPLFFGLLLIIVPLLPALYFRGTGSTTFAERYLYLPSVGFVFVVVLLTPWTRIKNRQWAVGLSTAFLLLLALYSIGTISRNSIWRDNYALWSDTVLKSPDAALPRNNFGTTLMRKGLVDEAVEQFLIALKLEPDLPATYNNLGSALMTKGLTYRAIEQFHASLELNPDVASVHNNLGYAYRCVGWTDKAIEEYMIALRLSPDLVTVRTNLGNAYYDSGRLDEAIKQYQIAAELMPDSASARFNLGVAFERQGLKNEAIREFQTAVALKPDFAEARRKLEVMTGGKVP